MHTINLKAPWTFRTIERTIDYPEGSHSVDDEVFAAAVAAGVSEGKANERTAKAGSTGAADAPQG